jgi:hypothetical protein
MDQETFPADAQETAAPAPERRAFLVFSCLVFKIAFILVLIPLLLIGCGVWFGVSRGGGIFAVLTGVVLMGFGWRLGEFYLQTLGFL